MYSPEHESVTDPYGLLSMARRLLAATTARAALEVIGAEMASLGADQALILLRQNGASQSLQFSAPGRQVPTDLASALYHLALHALTQKHDSPSRVGKSRRHAPGDVTTLQTASGSALLTSFPPTACDGVLLLNWHARQDGAHLGRVGEVLLQIAQLAGACLASLNAKKGREARLNARVAVLHEAGRRHAEEMRMSEAQTAQAHDLASKDAMTGLQNRRGFFTRAEHCFVLARQQALACAVVFADVDGLKTVNDELGHKCGDELIRHGAQVFQSAFQAGDVVARLGGDEFAAFTFDDAAPEAIHARLNDCVADFNRAGGFPSMLSLSAGVVSCDIFSNASLADYLQLADVEMYQQKHRHVRCTF